MILDLIAIAVLFSISYKISCHKDFRFGLSYLPVAFYVILRVISMAVGYGLYFFLAGVFGGLIIFIVLIAWPESPARLRMKNGWKSTRPGGFEDEIEGESDEDW